MSKVKIKIDLTPPFATLLAILFIGLKLTGFITWNWFWVLSPIWIPFCLFLTFLSLVLFISIVSALVK